MIYNIISQRHEGSVVGHRVSAHVEEMEHDIKTWTNKRDFKRFFFEDPVFFAYCRAFRTKNNFIRSEGIHV